MGRTLSRRSPQQGLFVRRESSLGCHHFLWAGKRSYPYITPPHIWINEEPPSWQNRTVSMHICLYLASRTQRVVYIFSKLCCKKYESKMPIRNCIESHAFAFQRPRAPNNAPGRIKPSGNLDALGFPFLGGSWHTGSPGRNCYWCTGRESNPRRQKIVGWLEGVWRSNFPAFRPTLSTKS